MRKDRNDIIETLRKTGLWDDAAIGIFLSFADEDDDGTLNVHREAMTEVHLIGSLLYREMFQASALPPKEKALLPIRQMGGFLDENGMLQLQPMVYHFSPALPPHALFWEEYAEAVRRGFPQGLSALEREAKEMRMVHQFRMYIDRSNIDYIRRKYPKGDVYYEEDGAMRVIRTDLDSLQAYGITLTSAGYQPLYFDEPSRYHNKLYGDEVFDGQINDKIETANRHSEFIVDPKTGSFVTQWDVLMEGPDGLVRVPEDPTVEQQRAILDSESFNYGVSKADHYKYDIEPAREDRLHSLEYDYKQELKESLLWHNIPLATYREAIRLENYPAMAALPRQSVKKPGRVLLDQARQTRIVQQSLHGAAIIRRNKLRSLAVLAGTAAVVGTVGYVILRKAGEETDPDLR